MAFPCIGFRFSRALSTQRKTPPQRPLRVCAVARRRFPVGANPTQRSLQPEATGAVREVMKWLKLSNSVSQIGDSASVQAATRVNSEQAINVTDALESLDEGVGIGHNNANCDDCGSRWDNRQTAPVGSFQPNAFGLHDMLGNVFEWTCSEYKESYDGSEKSGCSCERDQTFTVKLKCAFQARLYSLRGGSWDIGPGKMRSANRGYGGPGLHSHLLGFRLARDN